MDKKQHYSFIAQKNSKQNKRHELLKIVFAVMFFLLLVAISGLGGNDGLTHI